MATFCVEKSMMGSTLEFGKSQDARKLVDVLKHLTQRLNSLSRLNLLLPFVFLFDLRARVLH